MTSDLSWFRDRIRAELKWIDKLQVVSAPDMTPDKWVEAWLTWAQSCHFLKLFGTQAGMILRPVRYENLFEFAKDYFGTLFGYDIDGDVALIDFAYGPGHYRELIGWLKSCGCAYVAWEHQRTGKPYVMPLKSMPSRAPLSKKEQ